MKLYDYFPSSPIESRHDPFWLDDDNNSGRPSVEREVKTRWRNFSLSLSILSILSILSLSLSVFLTILSLSLSLSLSVFLTILSFSLSRPRYSKWISFALFSQDWVAGSGSPSLRKKIGEVLIFFPYFRFLRFEWLGEVPQNRFQCGVSSFIRTLHDNDDASSF